MGVRQQMRELLEIVLGLPSCQKQTGGHCVQREREGSGLILTDTSDGAGSAHANLKVFGVPLDKRGAESVTLAVERKDDQGCQIY